jgi:glutamate racemase
MKIGIFDSGLGGLIVAQAIHKIMPEYDYVYLGDTKRVPYGDKSQDTIYKFTREAMDYLFKEEDCAIVLVACNTVSARALREIQQNYLPKNFKGRKVLGVLIPSAEMASSWSIRYIEHYRLKFISDRNTKIKYPNQSFSKSCTDARTIYRRRKLHTSQNISFEIFRTFTE